MADKEKAIFRHCVETYEAMMDRAKPFEDTDFYLYTGFLTKLITEDLGQPNAYYTTITNELVRMGCAQIMRRGGGASPSEWLLLKAPSQDDFDNMPELKRKETKREAEQAQWRRTVNERLETIEKALGLR